MGDDNAGDIGDDEYRDEYQWDDHFDDLYAMMRRATRSSTSRGQTDQVSPPQPDKIRTKIVVITEQEQQPTQPAATTRKRKRKSIPELIKRRLLFQQSYKCNLCRKLLPEDWEVDHIKPLWNSGKNILNNLQILCHVCHHNKTNNEAIELYGLGDYFQEEDEV